MGISPFEGICLVDTFELAEDRQLPLFAPENTRRVEDQKKAPMFVVIGNPPYNVWDKSTKMITARIGNIQR